MRVMRTLSSEPADLQFGDSQLVTIAGQQVCLIVNIFAAQRTSASCTACTPGTGAALLPYTASVCVCLSILSDIPLSLSVSICLLLHFYICLSFCKSVYQFVRPTVRPSVQSTI